MSANRERNIIIQNLYLLVQNQYSFEDLCLEIFQYQKAHNEIYREYLMLLNQLDLEPKNIAEIPCLPINFFKTKVIKTGAWYSKRVFQSSGTTGQTRSKHHIRSVSHYHQNSKMGFEQHFEVALKDCTFYNLLPGYTDNTDSSLVSMMDFFSAQSKAGASKYLDFGSSNSNPITQTLKNAPNKSFLFGVSFALLDLAEKQSIDLSHLRIVETGGMKSHKRDITKDEILQILKDRFNLDHVYSEYGMTELLSQAYTNDDGKYLPAKTMKIFIKELNDPFSTQRINKSGQINIIDLANFDSCAFIATQDLGRSIDGHSFEIMGRLDGSEVRGCNLIYET